MKMRQIKINPETLMELLQGKTSASNSNLPKDIELIDLKYDAFLHQVFAIIRSDTFEDTKETLPVPEFNLAITATAKTTQAAPVAAKPETKPAVKPQPQTPSQTAKNTYSIEDEFSPDQRKLLSFTSKDDSVIVKPTQFLKAEWNDINDVVKSLGGRWVKGDIISYWEIPSNQS